MFTECRACRPTKEKQINIIWTFDKQNQFGSKVFAGGVDEDILIYLPTLFTDYLKRGFCKIQRRFGKVATAAVMRGAQKKNKQDALALQNWILYKTALILLSEQRGKHILISNKILKNYLRIDKNSPLRKT